MTPLSACEEEAARTIASTLRETEFSTRLTWAETSASEVAPKRPTWTPQSFPAVWEPASIACQNCESVALTMTSTRLLVAGAFALALVEVGANRRPSRTPMMRPTRAIAATVESVNGVLKNRDISDLLLFVVDNVHSSTAVQAIERADT